MKFEWPWKRQKITLETDLKLLESKLEAFFQPVTPRVEFVKNLRLELVGKPKRSRFSLPEVKWQRAALLAGGIVSFFGLVFGGLRIVVAVIALLQGNRKRIVKDSMAKEAIAV
ncbi:MAG: hypothetical protein JW757_00770 [Anaerolineales bacterium]|nr:hypothetical protein [Anaerolineales bacterium]